MWQHPVPIPVSEKLPEDHERVLAWNKDGPQCFLMWVIALYDSEEGAWYDEEMDDLDITHWIPLPNQP